MSKRSENYLRLLKIAIDTNDLKKFSGNSILVTGGTGLIGTSIVDIFIYLNEKLNKNIDIFVASRNYEHLVKRFGDICEKEYFHFVKYDATKKINFNFQVDYIIQGASNANPNLYMKKPVETLMGNIIGLNNILDYALRQKTKRVVYISSSEVYGNKIEGRNKLINEEDFGLVDKLKPRFSYTNGKRAAENLCIDYAYEYGIESIIIRPGHIYSSNISKGDNRAATDFLRCAYENRAIKMYSSGNQLRSYCHAIDCASAIIFSLINGKNCQAYNVSNKDSVVTIRQFAKEVAKIGQVNLICGKVNDSNGMEYSALDSRKLENLGWHAVVNLQEGIKEAIADLN